MNANQAAPRRALIKALRRIPQREEMGFGDRSADRGGHTDPLRERGGKAELPQLVGIERAEGRSGLVSLRSSDAYGKSVTPGSAGSVSKKLAMKRGSTRSTSGVTTVIT